MGKDRKNYKKDTMHSEKAQSLLDDMHTKYDDDELLEEILMETLDTSSAGRRKSEPLDLAEILGEKPRKPGAAADMKMPEKESGTKKAEKISDMKMPEKTPVSKKAETVSGMTMSKRAPETKKAGKALEMTMSEKAPEVKKAEPAPEVKKAESVLEMTMSEKAPEEKKAEPAVEEKKAEPVLEAKKAEPAVEEKKAEAAPEVKKDEKAPEVKEPEKPAKEEKSEKSGGLDVKVVDYAVHTSGVIEKTEKKQSLMNLAELVEYSEEDRKVSAEISASVSAAIAEKAEKNKAAKKAEDDGTAKKKKAAKKKTPEIKPMKPILSVANIVYTAVAFAAVTAAFLALPREDVSETEQRKLAEFPAFSAENVISGNYTNGITNYFNDNVPYRDDLKKVAAQIRNLYGISYNDAEIIGPVAVVTDDEEPEPVIDEPEQTTTAPAETTSVKDTAKTTTARVTTTAGTTTTPETTTQPAETTKNVNEIAAGVVTNGQVVTKLSDGHWWGISLYGGGNGKTYATCLNRFKKELGEDVNVWSMPVPTSGEYYLPDSYAQYNASHAKSIEQINAQLKGVTPVDAVSALWEHVGEKIYLRTDHHWQPLGAYYAAKAFVEAAGLPFADVSTMERIDIDGYMGTMYSFTESANLLADPETFTYYKPQNKYTTYYYDTAYNFTGQFPFFLTMPVNGSYSTFMGADNKIVRIKTDAGTGRKLVIFKDSYGNAEIPFYFNSFDEVYVCDMRYFDLNGVQFIKFTGATDVLFTCCTFSAVGSNANGLNTILNNPETEITEGAGR